jgi:hypothetical protein
MYPPHYFAMLFWGFTFFALRLQFSDADIVTGVHISVAVIDSRHVRIIPIAQGHVIHPTGRLTRMSNRVLNSSRDARNGNVLVLFKQSSHIVRGVIAKVAIVDANNDNDNPNANQESFEPVVLVVLSPPAAESQASGVVPFTPLPLRVWVSATTYDHCCRILL